MSPSNNIGVGCFLVFSVWLAPVEAGEAYRIHDGGQERLFEVAANELYVGGEVKVVNPEDVQKRGVRDVARRAGISAADAPALVLYEQGKQRTPANRRFLSEHVLIASTHEAALKEAVRVTGAVELSRPDYAPGYALLRYADALGTSLEAIVKLTGIPGLTVEGPLLRRWLTARYVPSDTLFPAQWYLRNTGQASAISAGLDIRVTNAWSWGYTGEGVVIGVVDNGLDYRHPDLSPNYRADLSRNWNGYPGGVNDPLPAEFIRETHGTAVAGIAAGRWNNNEGISGVAPLASLAGLRLIAEPVGDLEESQSVAHRNDAITIKNNSWGPTCDDGLTGPGVLMQQALANSVVQGRGGLGTIHVWAGGNEREDCEEDANTDGYANSIYTISVAAIGNDGRYASYSDPGACHIVSSPGSDGNMVTTYNLGEGDFPGDADYTGSFNGTSSAAPVVSGVIALMLEGNPELGWRDVQEILIRSARKIDPNDSGWAKNAAGFHFNHNYGAGMVDASAAVEMAYYWTNLAAQTTHSVTGNQLNRWIPDTCQPVEVAFTNSKLMRLEHVTVTVDIDHAYRGDLEIELVAPSGMSSLLARARNDAGAHYPDWTFMTVRHWGESGQGVWRLRFTDCQNIDEGYLHSASITFHGTDAAGSSPEVVPVPISPAGTVSNRTPLFIWSQGSHQAWYRLYVTDGKAKVIDTWIQSATSYQYNSLLKGGNYTWYVVGWDSRGLGPWSSAATFNIPFQTPQKIQLIRPMGLQNDFSFSFQWEGDPDATWYQLRIDEASGKQFLSKWYFAQSSTIISALVSGLTPSKLYTWYVRPWGPDGFGPWSDEGVFTMPSGQPLLLNPSGMVTSLRPEFSWSSAAGASWYRLYVMDSRNRGKVMDTWTQQTSHIPVSDLMPGEFTWWVGAWGPTTQKTIWSSSKSFEIGN